MGIERTAVSAKVSPEIEEFLFEWARQHRPYRLSSSEQLEKCAEVVMVMVRRGQLSLEPKALQEFLENGSNGGNESKRKKQSGI